MDSPKGLAAGNTKYCFNEYLETASEIGLIGLLLFTAVIGSVLFGIRKVAFTAKDNSCIPSFLNSLIIPISSLISLIVMALISFPFYSLPTLIVFFFLAALISSNIKGIKVSERLINTVILRRHNRPFSLADLYCFFLLSSYISALLLYGKAAV